MRPSDDTSKPSFKGLILFGAKGLSAAATATGVPVTIRQKGLGAYLLNNQLELKLNGPPGLIASPSDAYYLSFSLLFIPRLLLNHSSSILLLFCFCCTLPLPLLKFSPIICDDCAFHWWKSKLVEIELFLTFFFFYRIL